MKIETPRLRLRRYRAGDLEDFFAILSDPEAMRYWSTEPHADRKVTSDWLAKKLTMPAPTEYSQVPRSGPVALYVEDSFVRSAVRMATLKAAWPLSLMKPMAPQ